MPCFHPITAYNKIGGGLTWKIHESNGTKTTVSCKQCTGCRQEYSRQWALRNMHEASLWLNNIFITLTYDNEHLPEHGTLVKKDFQDFMKRLRKKKRANQAQPIRYYQCGEYGDKFGRPHYHAILFNTNFRDREIIQGQKGLTQSQTLSKLWGKGHSSIGDVTFQSAAYVAGYVQKKINGQRKDAIDPGTGLKHYEIITPNGEIIEKQQEYSTMSRRPGIAGSWFAKHKDDVYPSDNIHINGKEMRPPKYYDRLYEIEYPMDMEVIKEKRRKEMKETQHLRSPEALRQAEKTHKARMSIYRRNKL
jgi:hypothetical protein